MAKEKEERFNETNFKDENMEKDLERTRRTPYERTRAAVYATGNRWAIENFNATHN